MSFKYETCTKAAEAGDLEELKKMYENGCPWDDWTPARAAQNGHLECLKYCFENGCPWDRWTPTFAAANGHLECLKYLNENGCPWNIYTPSLAAEKGHLECLKYAHENGCSWDLRTPRFAAENGHLECFKYCFQVWDDQQKFWSINFDLSKIVNNIDLDDPVWRKLIKLDLSKHPTLESKVEDKKKKIEEIKAASKEALQNELPLDIIKYCLQPYF